MVYNDGHSLGEWGSRMAGALHRKRRLVILVFLVILVAILFVVLITIFVVILILIAVLIAIEVHHSVLLILIFRDEIAHVLIRLLELHLVHALALVPVQE